MLKRPLILLGVIAIIVGGFLVGVKETAKVEPMFAYVRTFFGPRQQKRPKTQGLLMFRGSPERNLYGTGDFSMAPNEEWKYPDEPMCARSSSGGVERIWCGTGWTGQPVVWDNPQGVREIIFGAYDRSVHFVDAATGQSTRSPLETGDIIKGSVTMDPDNYPLIYFGSRDNYLRIVSLQQDGKATELWKLPASSRKGIWNDDWDGNPIIKDDILYEGGENGWFYAIKLNRGYDENGIVAVNPEIIFSKALFNSDLIAKTDSNLSIENSPLLVGNTIYIANSGGRIVGFDITNIEEGVAPIVFDYWAGDDIDATLTTDGKGNIYAMVELERKNKRSQEVGQIVKLNPEKDGDPREWGISVGARGGATGGVWSTPAHYKGHMYVVTSPGDLLVVDTQTGSVVYEEQVGLHEWSSPSVVNDILVMGLCKKGALRGYSLAVNPAKPQQIWEIPVGKTGGCVESTPALYDGTITVGSRDGFMYHFK